MSESELIFIQTEILLSKTKNTSVNSNKDNFAAGIEMIKKIVKEKRNI